MAIISDPNSQRYYHGTKAELKPGNLIGPGDPENKYLYHSFVESPDMMNIYNGNITTDENGEAVVTLPDYFEALNADFRYHLTCIGAFAQAIVADKIKGNRFQIKTSAPNVEVSWQVTGVVTMHSRRRTVSRSRSKRMTTNAAFIFIRKRSVCREIRALEAPALRGESELHSSTFSFRASLDGGIAKIGFEFGHRRLARELRHETFIATEASSARTPSAVPGASETSLRFTIDGVSDHGSCLL